MATLFSDNFNRADSSSLGANWTESNPDSGDDSSIASNRLRMTTAAIVNNPVVAYCTTTAHAAVADCKASITRITGSGFDGGPLVRRQGAADTFYYLDVDSVTPANTVYRRTSGADTAVATRSFTVAANDIYRLEVTGSGATVTLKIFQNGTQQGADVTDSNAARITGAGQTGVLGWAPANSVIDWDDFLAEDFTVVATSTMILMGTQCL